MSVAVRPKLFRELRRRGGEPDAIDVVDENADAEETTDHPASPRYLLACIRHFESSLATQDRGPRPEMGNERTSPRLPLHCLLQWTILSYSVTLDIRAA